MCLLQVEAPTGKDLHIESRLDARQLKQAAQDGHIKRCATNNNREALDCNLKLSSCVKGIREARAGDSWLLR